VVVVAVVVVMMVVVVVGGSDGGVGVCRCGAVICGVGRAATFVCKRVYTHYKSLF